MRSQAYHHAILTKVFFVALSGLNGFGHFQLEGIPEWIIIVAPHPSVHCHTSIKSLSLHQRNHQPRYFSRLRK